MRTFEILQASNDTILVTDRLIVKGWSFLGESINNISLEEFDEMKKVLTFETVSYNSFDEAYTSYKKYSNFILYNKEYFKLNKITPIDENSTDDEFDYFLEIYKPILKNGQIRQFETYGEDLEEIKKANAKNVWTVLDGEGQSLILTNGIWVINRMFYLICEIECEEEKGNINIEY